MEMVCADCLKRSKKENWYPFRDVKRVPQEACSFHPVLSNWRVVRTLKTIKTWSLDVTGATVALSSTCRMPIQMGGGHVHERTARAKLFDYEGPFLDLLVKEGLLDRHEGCPTTLTVTERGDKFIHLHLLEREIRDGVKTTADFMRQKP